MTDIELLSPDIIRKKIRSARLSDRRSIKACADLLHISLDRYAAYETGAMIPSLPEIEMLCTFFNLVPAKLLENDETTIALHPNFDEQSNYAVRMTLSQKIIGAKIRHLREEQQLTPTQLASEAAFTEDDLESFEFGRMPIRLTILFRILSVLHSQYSDLLVNQSTSPLEDVPNNPPTIDQKHFDAHLNLRSSAIFPSENDDKGFSRINLD